MIQPLRALPLLVLLAVTSPGCGKTILELPDASGSLTAQTLGKLDLSPRVAEAISLSGPLALIACGDDGVVVVDISRPDAPIELATIDTVVANTIAAEAERVFVMNRERVTGTAERVELDLLDPRNPMSMSTNPLESGDVVAVAVEGPNTVFVTGSGGALRIGRLSKLELDIGEESALAAAIRRGHLYVITATDSWRGFGPGTLRRFDADSGTPNGSLPLVEPIAGANGAARGTRADVVVARDSVLINTGDRILQVDDLSLSTNRDEEPSSVGPIRTMLNISATALAAELDIAAAAAEDVVLIDLQGTAATVAALIKTPGTVVDVALQDGILAVADDTGGLRLFQISRPGSSPEE